MNKLPLTLSLCIALAAPAIAAMQGDFEIQAPSIIFPGETKTFKFSTCNNSPDGEWTAEVQMRFPVNWDILSGWYDDLGQGWNFDFVTTREWGEYAHFLDADGGRGEIESGQCGYFYITVHLCPDVNCAPVQIRSKHIGDNWGCSPHYFAQYLGYTLCVIPVESTSWSTVKSLY